MAEDKEGTQIDSGQEVEEVFVAYSPQLDLYVNWTGSDGSFTLTPHYHKALRVKLEVTPEGNFADPNTDKIVSILNRLDFCIVRIMTVTKVVTTRHAHINH